MKESKSFAFFAAANGYSGFRSYFDEVFNPKDYGKIYILKGGPGTGKSTLMRALLSHFTPLVTHSEAIYCSSDPASLDGVILKTDSSSVAIIDGTAPHERDAIFPGAADEIINLGEGWDSRWLEAKRDTVISLAEEKRSAYKTAYSYLRVAGEIKATISSLENVVFDSKNAKKAIKHLAELIEKIKKPHHSSRLISAFGKSGLVLLGGLKEHSKYYFSVRGSTASTSKFLSFLWEETSKTTDAIRIPSPLDDSVLEAIYYPKSELAVCADEADDNTIFADEFCKISPLDKERARPLYDTESHCLIEAERWFKIAADLHARLEEIYSEAMNFDKNNKALTMLTENIAEKIRS